MLSRRSEDIHSGIRPGDGIYLCTLLALDRITGTGFGRFHDVEEDWTSRPGRPDISRLQHSHTRTNRALEWAGDVKCPGPAPLTGLVGLKGPGGLRGRG